MTCNMPKTEEITPVCLHVGAFTMQQLQTHFAEAL